MIRMNVVAVSVLQVLVTQSASAGSACENWLKGFEKGKGDQVVFEVMQRAGNEILKIQKSKDFHATIKKNFSDLKTVGDCVSQEMILKALSQNASTSRANFMAEESCKETLALTQKKNSDLEPTWVLDPIDGTTRYLHGQPHYSISLGLVIKDEVCFGAVYAPAYEEYYSAKKGKGAFLRSRNGKSEKLSVSPVGYLNMALWLTGTEGGPKKEAIEKNQKTFQIASSLLQKTHDMSRSGSASLDLAHVASGRAEAYFELSEGLNWWDVAAGSLLVTEAGGKVSLVTDPDQASQDPLDRPIVYILASNGQSEIHDGIQELRDAQFTKKEE